MNELSKLKNDVSYLINEMKELKTKGYTPGAQSGGSSHMDNFDIDNEVHDYVDPLLDGKNACYLYVNPGRRYVGRWILHNDLNDRILHGIPLEEGYVRVQFEVTEKKEFNTKLPRPCDEVSLVREAPGYFLAWPQKLVSIKLETSPRTVNKETGKNATGQKKFEDKENHKHADREKEKPSESIIHISSKQFGYPLLEDVCHDGVLEFVHLAILFDRVTDIQVEMRPFWDADPWIDHINKENILEVLNAQWLSASSLVFYIRYLSEVFLSKNLDMATKFSFVSAHQVSHLVDNSNTFLAKSL
ncbi:uncharacterized protein LOC141671823 isoform X2 [Apium graveolens]|uniref:uncharacterized protein LOC141671823 isoform X2 n=1 Tax=Apium graveolens TaxID=4045 RepID=UPI003D791902